MTRISTRSALAVMAMASALVAPALGDETPTVSSEQIVFQDGTFRQGAHRLALDDRGIMYLIAGDGKIVDGIALGGMREGEESSPTPIGLTRREDGFEVRARHGDGAQEYSINVTPGDESMVLRIERQGALPTEDCQDFLRLALPIEHFRGNRFYTERITLPYDDRTFEDPMIIDGFREFHAHTTDDTLNFILNTEEPVMRISDPWQERRGSYWLEIPLPAGEESSIEVTLQFPPSSGNLLDPAVRFSAIGYRTNGTKRAILEWHNFVDTPDLDVRVVAVDGRVALEGYFGEPTPFLGKHYAEFDFSDLEERGVYRFAWSGGETDFFVVRDTIIQDSLWTSTLERFIPWQMSHAGVNFGTALPPKRPAFMDDGVRAPANVFPVGGFISHGQEGSLYGPGEIIPANIGGWFDGGVTHQSVPTHAFTVWMLSLAHEQFKIELDSAAYNQLEQTYSLLSSDGVPDILTQIEWGVWWLLQMQEPTGRVYVGIASRPERDTVMVIPERTTDGEPNTDDERLVFVDYHPHIQLAQVAALSAAARHLAEVNRALSRRALDSAREAFEYFAEQPEVYRPTVNFPYTNDHPAVLAGRDSMLILAAAELYMATQDQKYLELLEAMKDNMARIEFEDPAPRWSRDSGLWYAAPSLARLHHVLADGDLREAVEGYLSRAADEKKAYLSQKPWPFAPQDVGARGVNSAALAQVFDAYWISQVVPDAISVEDALPAFEWVVGMHPLNNLTFVTGVGYDAPNYLFNANIHGRVRSLRAVVPGAVMPGISRLPGNELLTYTDLPLKPEHHDARISDQATWIFAVHALRDAGF